MIGRKVKQSGLENVIEEDLIALGGEKTKGREARGRERGHTKGGGKIASEKMTLNQQTVLQVLATLPHSLCE